MQLHFEDRETWRTWLVDNHRQDGPVWLVFDKKHTGKKCVTYDAAVEEALCFGWIDSIIKRIDEDRYARKFSPRTNTSKWSATNLERFEKLVASGRMTEVGLVKLKRGTEPVRPVATHSDRIPDFFAEALAAHAEARRFFEGLAPSYRRNYIAWVSSAKRESTRLRRLEEALTLLRQGKKLGMK